MAAPARRKSRAPVFTSARIRIRKVLNLRGPRGGRSANFYTIHQLLQPVIHIAEDGKSARARVRLFQMGGAADGSSASWIGGVYENTALYENGEWKFGIQELYHAFNASYRNGWARVGPVARALAGQGKAGAGSCGRRNYAGPGWRAEWVDHRDGNAARSAHPGSAVCVPGDRRTSVSLSQSSFRPDAAGIIAAVVSASPRLGCGVEEARSRRAAWSSLP